MERIQYYYVSLFINSSYFFGRAEFMIFFKKFSIEHNKEEIMLLF